MSSFRQVRDFVNLAKEQSFEVRVSSGKQEVNGKDCNIYKVYIGSSKMNTKEMCGQRCRMQNFGHM